VVERVEREFLDPAVLARLGNLSLFARKPMLGNVSGRHRSPHRGSSIEFAEYRKYVAGDDPRRLDWRAYGRSDRFYVKEFEADTNLRLVPVLDVSGSMRYPTTAESKLQYAKKLVATLAYLASQQGDAVGLVCAASKLGRQIPPRRNPAHLRAIYEALNDIQAGGETGLVDALHAVAEQTSQRALVVIVSDLFVPPAELAQSFQHLRFRKHDVVVFHLLEDAELDFHFDRPTRFLDLEGGAAVLIEPSAIRREYAAALQQYLTGLDVAVREAAVDYHRIRIHESHGDVLARFLLARTPRRTRR
jgi:uncharacterized protein (DUF58 family)